MTADDAGGRRNVRRAASARLPTRHGVFEITAYDADDHAEHVALSHGELDPSSSVLARVHSSCVTGDVFGSTKCDCGEQLDEAMRRIAAEGAGVVVYLDQEGRGIGLANKIRAYAQQDLGLDTVDANLAVGFDADLRSYAPAAEILDDLGVTAVRLMTNNPRKVSALRKHDVDVTERLPIRITPNAENRAYLATKARRLDHDLPQQR